jgi:ferritin-like metal-binding protein YciE
METKTNHFRLLLEQTTALYAVEKEIARIIPTLQYSVTETALQEAITRESVENKNHCARLEGLLTVLDRAPFQAASNENLRKNFVQQFSTLLQRVAIRHAAFGYKAAIFVALALGQNEMATLLRLSASNGNLLLLK